jgi:hypothetical protein
MSQVGQQKRESKAGSAQGEQESVFVRNEQAEEDWGLEGKESNAKVGWQGLMVKRREVEVAGWGKAWEGCQKGPKGERKVGK